VILCNYDFLTAVLIQFRVSWEMALCRLVYSYCCFKGASCHVQVVYSEVRNILLIFIVFKFRYGVDTYISLSKTRHVAIGWSRIASSHSVTVQNTITMPEICTFNFLLLVKCFGHKFDHYDLEQMQIQNMLYMSPLPLHNQSTKMY
jgi:hypothetical protein